MSDISVENICQHFSRHKVRALQYTFEQIYVVTYFQSVYNNMRIKSYWENNQLNKRKIYLNRAVQEYRYKEPFCISVAWRSW
jgi:hypothetical protein